MKKNILLSLLMVLALSCISLPAKASLFIAPLRAVFDEGTRTKTISLLNRSDETRTYRVDFVEKKMEPNGSYEELSTVPDFAASPYLIVSPHQVTLKPGERQNVRISYRKPADLAPGEYHSHLLFKLLPVARSHEEEDVKGMQLKMYLEMSVAIPMIIRQKVSSVETKMSDISFTKTKDEKPAISLTISREGDISSHGRFVVYNDEKNVVGRLNNVTLFTEVKSRSFEVPLKPEALSSKELYITYEGVEEFSGQTWDQKTLKLK